jgi:hypothetical protein
MVFTVLVLDSTRLPLPVLRDTIAQRDLPRPTRKNALLVTAVPLVHPARRNALMVSSSLMLSSPRAWIARVVSTVKAPL